MPTPVQRHARMPGTGLSDEERWTAALAQVQSSRPRTVAAARRSPHPLIWLLALVGVLTALSLSLLALQLLGAGPPGRQTVAWVAAVLLVVLYLGGALAAWGSGTLSTSWSHVQPQLTRAQRRHVRGQLDGRVSLDPAHAPLVREFAFARVSQFPLALLAVGVQQGRMGDLDGRGAFHWVDLCLLLVWLAVLGRFAVVLRRVRRFVHAHPEPVRR